MQRENNNSAIMYRYSMVIWGRLDMFTQRRQSQLVYWAGANEDVWGEKNHLFDQCYAGCAV